MLTDRVEVINILPQAELDPIVAAGWQGGEFGTSRIWVCLQMWDLPPNTRNYTAGFWGTLFSKPILVWVGGFLRRHRQPNKLPRRQQIVATTSAALHPRRQAKSIWIHQKHDLNDYSHDQP
jgi:hypothetical protein